jgi:Protein of unknown function (DUF4232)
MPHSYGLRRAAVLIVATAGLLLAAAACAQPGSGTSSGGVALPPAPASAPTGASPTTAPVTTHAVPPPAADPAPAAPAAAVAGAPCSASGLAFVSQFNQGAMGSAISTFTVRNRGPVSCTLRGTPALLYIGGDGQAALVPGDYTGAGNVVTVKPGGRAQFDVKVVNGMGGYPPGSPQCGHPATFHHVSAELPDGSSLALGTNATISYQCEQADVAGWTTAG